MDKILARPGRRSVTSRSSMDEAHRGAAQPARRRRSHRPPPDVEPRQRGRQRASTSAARPVERRGGHRLETRRPADEWFPPREPDDDVTILTIMEPTRRPAKGVPRSTKVPFTLSQLLHGEQAALQLCVGQLDQRLSDDGREVLRRVAGRGRGAPRPARNSCSVSRDDLPDRRDVRSCSICSSSARRPSATKTLGMQTSSRAWRSASSMAAAEGPVEPVTTTDYDPPRQAGRRVMPLGIPTMLRRR